MKKRVCFEEGCIAFFDADEGTVYAAAAPKDRCLELYRCPLDGGLPVKLTDVNGDFFEKKFVSPVKYTPFVNSEGISIDGWVIYPKDYDETKRYPALYEIHGGPRCGLRLCVLCTRCRRFASKGYFVFFCNPRGSEGKGEEFADIRGKHGTIDYRRFDGVYGSYPGGHVPRSTRSVSPWLAARMPDSCATGLWATPTALRPSPRSAASATLWPTSASATSALRYDREAAGGDAVERTPKSSGSHSPLSLRALTPKRRSCSSTPCAITTARIDQGVEMFSGDEILWRAQPHVPVRGGKPQRSRAMASPATVSAGSGKLPPGSTDTANHFN